MVRHYSQHRWVRCTDLCDANVSRDVGGCADGSDCGCTADCSLYIVPQPEDSDEGDKTQSVFADVAEGIRYLRDRTRANVS